MKTAAKWIVVLASSLVVTACGSEQTGDTDIGDAGADVSRDDAGNGDSGDGDSGNGDSGDGDSGNGDSGDVDSGADVEEPPGEGACVQGEAVAEQGCHCQDAIYFGGYCCEEGWQGEACDYEPVTCADLDVEGCVEVWPGEQREGYEFVEEHRAYFFRDLSNADHYFLLMGDIECDSTCAVFGMQDGTPTGDATTTLDLNGYSMTYTAGEYEALPNQGFEAWNDATPQGWSVVSGGPVEARSTAYYMPMSGASVLYTSGPVVLESELISLPLARAYQGYVTVGRADDTDITLEVVRDDGEVLCSQTKPGFFRGQSFACRFDSTEAGRYRLRLSTEGSAYFDMTGIVPIGDFGVATLTGWSLSEGNARQQPIVQNLAGANIPASGDTASPETFNHLEVKNGAIIAGHENQLSTAVRVSGISRLNLHRVNVVARGLKSHSVSANGQIHGNRLEVNMPWYFARENSDEENVLLGGGHFHHNTAIGGQGVIRLRGEGTEINHNYLVNNAQATNHYAIIQSGASNPSIHDNIFDPIEGSGILTYTGHGYRIFNNTFYVRSATCNVEYLNEDYSTNGIRMNDYNAESNYDNHVYDNVFHIEGQAFDTAWENCMPVTTGIFYSASGADNRIYGNAFYITKTDANEADPVIALYMGGGAKNNPVDNPLVYDNLFETNDKAVWLTTYYGESVDLWLENNVFRRVPNTYYEPAAPEAAIRMGRGSSDAENVRLVNNHFEGGFEVNAIQFTAVSTNAAYDLTARWYVHVRVVDEADQPVEGAQVLASSTTTDEEASGITNSEGEVTLVVTEYVESGDMTPDGVHERQAYSPHRVEVTLGARTASVEDLMVDGEQTLEVVLGD